MTLARLLLVAVVAAQEPPGECKGKAVSSGKEVFRKRCEKLETKVDCNDRKGCKWEVIDLGLSGPCGPPGSIKVAADGFMYVCHKAPTLLPTLSPVRPANYVPIPPVLQPRSWTRKMTGLLQQEPEETPAEEAAAEGPLPEDEVIGLPGKPELPPEHPYSVIPPKWMQSAALPPPMEVLPPLVPKSAYRQEIPPLRTDVDCLMTPRKCNCLEILAQCNKFSYECDTDMDKLRADMPKVEINNFMSRFDHPLLDTLLQFDKKYEPQNFGWRIFDDSGNVPGGALVGGCTPGQSLALSECQGYFQSCDRARNQLLSWTRKTKGDTLWVLHHPANRPGLYL